MSDLIRRQDAIDACERQKDKTAKGEIGSFYNTIIQHDIDAIEQLPSAEPERKTGKWRLLDENNDKAGYRTLSCSVCGNTFNCVPKWKYRFCPNCGAKMEDEEE